MPLMLIAYGTQRTARNTPLFHTTVLKVGGHYELHHNLRIGQRGARMIDVTSLTSADVIHIAKLLNRISGRAQKIEAAALQDIDCNAPNYNRAISFTRVPVVGRCPTVTEQIEPETSNWDNCTSPRGHDWRTYGENNCRCVNCGADGDA